MKTIPAPPIDAMEDAEIQDVTPRSTKAEISQEARMHAAIDAAAFQGAQRAVSLTRDIIREEMRPVVTLADQLLVLSQRVDAIERRLASLGNGHADHPIDFPSGNG